MLEDVILACLDSCFGSYKPLDRALIRVTRNADIDRTARASRRKRITVST